MRSPLLLILPLIILILPLAVLILPLTILILSLAILILPLTVLILSLAILILPLIILILTLIVLILTLVVLISTVNPDNPYRYRTGFCRIRGRCRYNIEVLCGFVGRNREPSVVVYICSVSDAAASVGSCTYSPCYPLVGSSRNRSA